MDLLTPAKVWAAEDGPAKTIDVVHEEKMPRLQWWVMFASMVGPFVGLIIAIVLLWHRSVGGIGWPEIIVMVVMYSICGFSVTIGFHRLLTHKSYETYRVVRWMLAIGASAAAQGMAIKWCATHRRHHQMSDREGDPHSPHLHGEGFLESLRGFWHAHFSWCFDPDGPDLARSVADLLEDRVLLWIDQLYFVWVALGQLLPAMALGLYYHSWGGFVSGLIWGGIVRLFLMQHATWSVNSICHVWGTRPFQSSDHSRNNYGVALISLGEGWHNNHHAFPTSARHGLRWWQLDLSYLVIKAMSYVGLAWNVRVPTDSAMHSKLKSSITAPLPGTQAPASC